MAVEVFKETLPHSYQYDIALFEGSPDEYKAVLHTNLTSIPDIDGWVRAFERVTKTNWSVRATYPNLEKLTRKDYVCHLQNWRNRPVKGRKSLSRFKFNGCQADLIVKIKPITKATLFRYKWVRDGLPATITINFKHNHQVTSSESLQFRKLDPAVRKMFAGYFNLGMSASTATKYHQRRIETDPDIGNVAIALDDAARNPKRSTVSYLYSLWRESKLNELTDSDDEPGAVVAQLYHEQQRTESDSEQCQQQQQQQQQRESVGATCSVDSDIGPAGSQLTTHHQQHTDITSTVTTTTTSTTLKSQETESSATCSSSCVSTTNKRVSNLPTTLSMWRSLSAKVEKRLRQLAPRDSDILDGIAAMDAQLSQLSTYSQLLAFLHSTSLALHKQTVKGQEARCDGSINGNCGGTGTGSGTACSVLSGGSGTGIGNGSGTGSTVGTGGGNSSVHCAATVLHTEHRDKVVVPSRHRKHIKQLKNSSGIAVKRQLVPPPAGNGVKRCLVAPPGDSVKRQLVAPPGDIGLCDNELINMSVKQTCCRVNTENQCVVGAGADTGDMTPQRLLSHSAGGVPLETMGVTGVCESRETTGVRGSVLSTHCYPEFVHAPVRTCDSTYLQTPNWEYL